MGHVWAKQSASPAEAVTGWCDCGSPPRETARDPRVGEVDARGGGA
jgi:hypothetical protein